jgi:hypothetical protein
MARILPQMVSLSNNSRLTQSVAVKLQEKLDDEELAEFQRWLVLANSETQTRQKKGRYYF